MCAASRGIPTCHTGMENHSENRGKKLIGAVLAGGALALALSSCGAAGGLGGNVGGLGNIAGLAGKCPDLTKPEAIMAFDFASNFKVSAQAGAKLKAATA